MNLLQQPRWGEVGIIALVPDRWGPVWMDRHHVLSRLTMYFHVVWMHQPGWRECLSGVYRRRASSIEYPLKPEALHIYHPQFWLPRLGRPAWLAQLTSRRRFRHVCELLRARGCTKILLYLWELEFADALGEVQHDFSIYNVSDEYSFSSTETPVTPKERELLKSVGQVFIISPALMEKKGSLNPHTAFAPYGVDYWKYATPTAEPEDLRNIPHPRIGYSGHLKRMLNWSLLLELSARHSQWSFVFVGPKSPHPQIEEALAEMSRRTNVHFLGGKPADRLREYVQRFDVCMMPYVIDDYTKYIYPGKMHEYLASGNPVISTPVRSVQDFKEVVTIANNLEEWSSAIESALGKNENTQERRTARQKVAREHDWDQLVSRIAHTIAMRLGLPTPNALDNLCDTPVTTPLPIG
jgi:glycosyltransferase involved in cell wall biosynthesis